MVRLYFRRILIKVGICIILGVIFIQTFYISSYNTQQLHDNLNFTAVLQKKTDPIKLYFETDISYQLRLQLQEKIQFGSKLKEVAHDYFNAREGYNESYLDSIPIIRDDIPDLRPPPCKNIIYPRSRARVSVIINYHNELLSLVLRSVYSVLQAIPPHNFHEMILIDDGSDLRQYYDLQEIKHITDSFTVSVKHFRFEKNEGLIYSRRFGCLLATGDVLLVLDSHVEVMPGFIEPLLAITDENYQSVASPILHFFDTVGKRRMWSQNGSYLGFDPYLTWIFSVAPEGHRPYPAASVLGGAYVATKRFFEEVDYFGRGMEGWGYENIEISMKTWMCGKEIAYVPCSQVIHYNAQRSPMKHGDRKKPTHYLQNAALVVKSYFSEDAFRDFSLNVGLQNDLQKFNIDNYEDIVRENKEMLRKNGCSRDYAWIRKTLMPKIESYDGDTLVAHTLKVDEECVDLERSDDKTTWTATLSNCDTPKSVRKTLRLTIWEDLRILDRLCLDWGYTQLTFSSCHYGGGNQVVIYENNHIKSHNEDCLIRYNDSKVLGKGLCQPPQQSNYSVPKFHFDVFYKHHNIENAEWRTF